MQFQHNTINTTKVYNAVNDLFIRLNNTIERFSYDKQIVTVLTAAKEKLNKYLNEGAQPSMKLFKAARILDPYQFFSMNQQISTYIKEIPELKTCQDDWPVYIEIVSDYVKKVKEDEFNLLKFW